MKRARGLLGVVLAAAAVAAGCATNPATGRRDFVMMTESQELGLGRQYHEQILQAYRVYDDPSLQAYVGAVGEELAARCHRSHLDYRFTVLDSPEVNAFALPGGYIYITRGILAYLGSRAELAGVLGHEIGHVTARHAVRQHGVQQATTLGFILGSVLVPEFGTPEGATLLSQLGGALISGYGRDLELEADRFGAQYIARIGYRPESMIDVIGVLADQERYEIARARAEGREPRVYHGVFSTHPTNDQRLREVVEAARNLQREGSAGGPRAAEADAYVRVLDGLPFGPGAGEGVVRGRDFFHAELDVALRFPARWRIENTPEALVAQDPSGGALLHVSLRPVEGRPSVDAFVRDQLGVQLTGAQPLRVGSLPGITGLASVGTPWGQRSARVSVVLRGGGAWVFVGAAANAELLRRNDVAFLDAARSLRVLAPSERRLAAGLRLRVIEAEPGMTWASLARGSPLGDQAEAELRLLNGQFPAGEPEPGTAIKLVE